MINQLEKQPDLVKSAITGLTEEQINTPYREGGWTVRQVVHPLINLWDENKWAELDDVKVAPVEHSLATIDGIIARWVIMLKTRTIEDFKKELNHPELGSVTLEKMLQHYSWHGTHHAAQITTFRSRNL